MAEIKAALLPIRRGYEAPKETVNNPKSIGAATLPICIVAVFAATALISNFFGTKLAVNADLAGPPIVELIKPLAASDPAGDGPRATCSSLIFQP